MSGDEQGHLEVILEDINGKFDLVLEGHVTLEHMIHEHRAETRQDKRELQALIKTSHDSLDAKISKVSNELKETRKELKETRDDLREEMATGFETLGDKVNDMDVRDNALGYKVEGHEDRIRFLERKVA